MGSPALVAYIEVVARGAPAEKTIDQAPAPGGSERSPSDTGGRARPVPPRRRTPALGPLRRPDDRRGVAVHRPGAHAAGLVRGRRTGPARTLEAEVEAGRWAYGFLAYEAAPGLDPGLRTHPPEPGLPLAWFALTGAPEPAEPLQYAATDAPRAVGQWSCDWSPTRHAAAVEAVREAIAAGETYQVNLTTRLRAPLLDADALPRLYADLALAQRGAFNAYLDLGRHVIASASPELFVHVGADGRTATMRPMKGTAARGRTTAEDTTAVSHLRASAKERAENVMIVDLVRNDLQRVAEPGTVAVPSICAAERFETVHQLTSTITARLRRGVGLSDVTRALFPCGSITGAPKARTMQLIEALEDGPRGVYCGAIGLLAPPGAPYRVRLSVAIRTVVADRAAGEATYGVGGGITYPSQAPAEYAELPAKAAVLTRRPEDVALLETMRHDAATGIHQRERHLARLMDSAGYLGFALEEEVVRRTLARATRGLGDARVRLVAHRDGRLEIETGPLPEAPTGPVRLAVDDRPVRTDGWRTRHKTTLRDVYDERRARHPHADDVLLVNERGEVMESTIASVAVLLDGRWCTPPLDSGCLPGVERGALLARGELAERTLTPAELGAADDIVLISALRGRRRAVLTQSPAASPELDPAPRASPRHRARRGTLAGTDET